MEKIREAIESVRDDYSREKAMDNLSMFNMCFEADTAARVTQLAKAQISKTLEM